MLLEEILAAPGAELLYLDNACSGHGWGMLRIHLEDLDLYVVRHTVSVAQQWVTPLD